MSFVDSGKLGFYAGGLLTTAAFYGLGAFWRRHSSITPSALVKVLNSQLQKNPRVIEKLGADLRPAKFTAYAYSGGLRYGKDVEGWFPVAYSTPVLELMYQLNGNKSSAMVSTKVSKKNGQLVYHSLALDTNLGETLLIYGTQADVVYKGIVRLR
ncbi:hypothetical protein CAOG_02552 [Capsaspora owczarzaki ATCC 30864]|uniref:Mitochondrial import inner membrane translocase subunit Tim21 n=1 Tax=Capsaspora owczarzaki (strain ATCC 30864) TaxID=595528 RepID=A0A0D2VML5_CAPO3|nr:hypothetical protein CAOG_02552 [Capsaspora owczarzaki ATCC 30864]KJE91417.1 hypothetical protein CAOG_002552 [Capsaspora owczarzaki ATCC 30864]|eukprot:XP_004349302.1 hypothetical protein CAOG_02552 [Capsaspora owczarzaki ATCC 30864]